MLKPQKIVVNIKAAQPRVERVEPRETTWIPEILHHHLTPHNWLKVLKKDCDDGGNIVLCSHKFSIFTIVVIQHLLCPAGAVGIRVAGGLLYHEAVRHRCAASNQPENKRQ